MSHWMTAAVATVALLGASASVAQDTGFYVGADVGQSSIDSNQRGLDSTVVAAFESFGVTVLDGSSEVSEDAFTWGLIVGYRVLPYLAFEASYGDLGSFEYKARGTLSNGVSVTDGRVHIEANGQGPTLSALGILPIRDLWSVYARAGVAFMDVDYDISVTVDDQSASDSLSRSSENFLWGVGAGFTGGHWTTRVEYQQITDVGDNDVIGKADVSRIVLGVIYRF